jgi:uncharacterized membrane protein YqjE
MLGPVRELARTLLAFAATRTRLAATEVEEQALRLLEIAIWLAAAYLFAGAALVFGAVLVVLLFWDANRLLAAGLLAAACAPSPAAEVPRRDARRARARPRHPGRILSP